MSEKLALLLLKPKDEAFAILLEITAISWEAALKPDLTTDNIDFPFKKIIQKSCQWSFLKYIYNLGFILLLN